MYDLTEFRLGESPDEILTIETRQETLKAALELTKQSLRKLTIVSKDLEPCIYNQVDFVKTLKNLALNGHHVQIRILVSDIESILSTEHKLLDLSSKLPSYIELRKISLAYKNFNKAILIADETGYLYRENADRYEGRVNFNAPRDCKNWLDIFQEMWETALLDKNLRRIHL
jgi:hypothetical protein